jgi:3-isopropylmalate dehydrogenase
MTIRIALVPGDGIGKEVVAEGRKALELVDRKRGLGLVLDEKDWGADRWLKDKVGMPKGALDELRATTQAVYFGALGDPRIPDMAHGREILLGMRQGLDLYANYRPCLCLDERLSPLKGKGEQEIDMLVFRENTEDLYVSLGGVFKQDTPDEIAQDISINTRKGVERILRVGFEAARKRRKKLTMTDKHNAVRFGGGLWKRTFEALKKEYADVATDHVFVDVLAMEMVRKPERFDVIVANNLFGDILTDLGAALMGGLGLAASGNVNPEARIGLFEPVHGSAPDIAGKGIANPLAAFWTAGLMFDFLGHADVAKAFESCVRTAVKEGPKTPDLGGQASTGDMSAFFLERLERAL